MEVCGCKGGTVVAEEHQLQLEPVYHICSISGGSFCLSAGHDCKLPFGSLQGIPMVPYCPIVHSIIQPWKHSNRDG